MKFDDIPADDPVVVPPEAKNMKLSFQQRVGVWLEACFGRRIARDKAERNHRFVEEALELAQSCGCTKEEVLQLVNYVFNRPVGEKHQELGGTIVTLNALAKAHGMDAEKCGEDELKRCWGAIQKIRTKRRNKPDFGPLP